MKPEDDLISDWTENERSILSTAELDRPDPNAADRTLAHLGIGLGAGVATVATASKVAAAGAVARGSLWLKLAGAALIGGGVVGVVAVKEHRSPDPLHAVAPKAAAPVSRAVPSSVASVSEAPLVEAPPNLEPAPIPPEPVAPARSGATAKARNGETFAAEVRVIDEARQRLRAGDPQGALAALQRYSELVGRGGSLRAEATVVRIEALKASGDTQAANALAQSFLARNPKSAYADYVRRIVDGAK
ncbi:MAG TPA: hypothetical protein VFV94_15845 [Polyangiaceae bacterium]|nr:hypothetical protein [Polyangiaceae bacterium]